MSVHEQPQQLCQHRTVSGHRCHMPVAPDSQSLCTHHLNKFRSESLTVTHDLARS